MPPTQSDTTFIVPSLSERGYKDLAELKKAAEDNVPAALATLGFGQYHG